METLPVTLIVKAPNQQIEDQTVKCELSWTINKLKQHLSEVYPSNPPSHEQKLIYSGQLLSDSVVLKDVLRQYDGQDTHTVHLVCSPNSKVSPISKKPTRTEMPTHTTPEVTPTNSATEQRVPPNMQWYNHQNGDQQAMQFMMMQQAYFQYLHYMNLYYNAANQTTSQALPPNPNQLPLAQQQIENQQAVDQNGAAVQQPAAQQQQQDPERDQNRDWLDIFYTISRLMIFSSIIYFYSSPLRFIFVLLLCFGLYLYHVGFFRNVNVNNNNIVQGEAAQEEQTPSRLMVVWTFFTTFFASLIPEIPNVV
ncbi:homocysteine-responsive protein [Holotrichia oblita]|uniref:Homocysteine-responsive protein n=3 Tax=Holotrichia oblita TaxID=644536 RepID=A0ACB9TP29_HOLOL|nr:homocysteine-responsive protein [Holotrichia oblita]KAI4468538.1 homocysteine-responsive protein [Holotrichia oblita]KAI4468570.1 homocysteine-responsive protein [Holotrichia oblita]